MPVNKLWIEYTERAAWESVEALRRKLAEAEARIQRMAPSAAGWRELFDVLDGARREHALEGRTYAELVQGILGRLAEVQAQAAAATEELSRMKSLGVAGVIASSAPGPAWYDDGEDLEEGEVDESEADRFVRAAGHRCRTLLGEPGMTDIDGVLRAIELRVDSLGDMDDPGIAEAAVELGALAACLAALAVRSARSDRRKEDA